jgi:hypothetical protein
MRSLALGLALLGSGHLFAGTLTFKEITREVHAAADVKSVVVDFEFENKTDSVVEISRYESTCSCMSAQVKGGKMRYEPGEDGMVRATFDMGNFSGEVDKVLVIWLKGDPEDKPSIKLTSRVHIPILVSLEPKTVQWNIGDKSEVKAVKITMNYPAPIRILKLSGSNPLFNQELKTIEEGKRYELCITPSSTAAPGLGIIRIETDCPVSRHKVQQAFAVVRNAMPDTEAGKP